MLSALGICQKSLQTALQTRPPTPNYRGLRSLKPVIRQPELMTSHAHRHAALESARLSESFRFARLQATADQVEVVRMQLALADVERELTDVLARRPAMHMPAT